MTVLSLFDGMSCGQIALRDMGIPITRYYASEVDKFAIQQTQLNFPDTIQLGDVRSVDARKLGHIDLLIGGSPCQSFSFAGKRAGMSTTTNEKIVTLSRYMELKQGGFEFEGQSYLFWEYVRVLNQVRETSPDVFFMLENVEMGRQWENVINEATGVKGVHINSALVSAQVRKRIYWTNIRTFQANMFGPPESAIPQPKDRGILLKDILENGVPARFYLKQKTIEKLLLHKQINKANGNGFGAKCHDEGCKMSTIRVKGKSMYDLVCVAQRGRGSKGETTQQLEQAPQAGKTNCLTTVTKDNMILQRPRGANKGGLHADKSPTLSASAWEQNNVMAETENCTAIRIRRLTPLECARLQTIPDWYRWNVSETQQYKMLGNGWTIEVIKHIFSFLPFSQLAS